MRPASVVQVSFVVGVHAATGICEIDFARLFTCQRHSRNLEVGGTASGGDDSSGKLVSIPSRSKEGLTIRLVGDRVVSSREAGTIHR